MCHNHNDSIVEGPTKLQSKKIKLRKIVDFFYLKNLTTKEKHTFATMYRIC